MSEKYKKKINNKTIKMSEKKVGHKIFHIVMKKNPPSKLGPNFIH